MKLRYVTPAIPGFSRKKSWMSFVYFDEHGKRIHDTHILARIRSIGIPPAYTRVWICPFAYGHIQAVAYDARGRKQYLYHPEWIAQRSETKFHRLSVFANVLSSLRRRVTHDLGLSGMPKEKVIAAVVRLLDTTFVRIGNEEYAQENHSFGLTTLENRHVQGVGEHMRLIFKGKSGVVHKVALHDARLRKIVAQCQDIPGHELFAYLDEAHMPHDITSEDVNTYLHEITKEEITAKDFRTWHGTVIAATYLWSFPAPRTKKETQAHIRQAIEEASQALGNTLAICKKCYVHPRIFSLYQGSAFQEPSVAFPLKQRYPLLHMNELKLIQILGDF